jgi:hypothetical protein
MVKFRADLDSVWIRKDGMLRGAGLAAYFLDRIREGGQVPSWFTRQFTEKRIESHLLASAPRP